MKTFTLNRTAVLSIMAIAFLFGITSCAKSNLKKDINGGWALNSVTQNGVDYYSQIGASYTGVWIFDQKAETCNATNTITIFSESETSTEEMYYEVKDIESILLDGNTFTIDQLGSNNLVLSVFIDGEPFEYHFTK